MRTFRLAVLVSALLSMSSAALSEPKLLEVPVRYLVVPPSDGGSKRVSKDDIAFEFPLRWERAAELANSIDVTADDRRITLRQGQALVQTRLQFDDAGFTSASSFCVPRLADPDSKLPIPGMFGLLGRAIARSVTDGQFCLIDKDQDGQVDHSVLVNAGSAAARSPRPISPVSYVLTPGAVVGPGDAVKLRYRGGYSFELQIIQQGKARIFQDLTYRDGTGDHRFNRWLFGAKATNGVSQIEAPGFNFQMSSYDAKSKSALITWPAMDRPAVVPIPDDVKIRYGFGY